ncbi:3-oxoadipate enol-lactonase [Sneathiella limimaris]|uniref:3-oxoadipate enol-lactonase n=1 Tax=Sneathiella limimaris TaxID=1964213 RepID=UPI00146D97B2|nr:3-oxoadipate enol-lactonase [Sneathiella limimaris]
MQFVAVNGVTLHYKFVDAGAGKPVIVFANSLGTDFRIWDAIVEGMSGSCSFLLYDKRGHGLSSEGSPPYKMEDHIADVEALIEHVGLRDVLICGLSVGGMIAQGISLKRPDLIKAAVLCDTGHKIGTADMWQERIAGLEAGGLEPMVDAIMERWFTESFRREDNPVFQGCKSMLARQNLGGYIGTCHALRDADFTNELSNLKMPVLCVVGDQDLSTPPELVRELCGLIEGAELLEIKDAGHIPCVEQPAQLIAGLSSFLQKHLS